MRDVPTAALVHDTAARDRNVALLLKRVELVYDLARSTFQRVSGAYIGKTSRELVSTRFIHHHPKAKTGECVVLVTVAAFAEGDVPDVLKQFGVSAQALTLRYETLLTEAVKRTRIPIYDEEVAIGGGRVARKPSPTYVGVVYVMVVGSNEGVQ